MYNYIILSCFLFGSVFLCSKSLELINRSLLENKKNTTHINSNKWFNICYVMFDNYIFFWLNKFVPFYTFKGFNSCFIYL